MHIAPGPVFALPAPMVEAHFAPAEASAFVVTTFGLVVTHGGTSLELLLSPAQMRAVATVLHALSSVLGADPAAAKAILLGAATGVPADA
jgi:hypothetical protein